MNNNTSHIDYLTINKANWNTRTDIHIHSDFYQLEEFIAGKNMLNSIELNLLGDIKDKKILHLQCHFGLDSLSLSRMGAKVVGVDLSDKAIEKAQELNTQLGLDAQFICCNVYDLPQYLGKEYLESFDIVFTSYGTIGWLPELEPWAAIIQQYLKPKGSFVFAEFHPAVWMYDNDFKTIAYSYFKAEPIVETEEGTYADKNANIQTQSVTWNHGITEVLTALLKQNLKLEIFEEYDYSPYNCMNGMEEFEPNKFRISQFGNKLPLVYALRMGKE